jgi:Dolichyl-phosphate-mannose-protein mannosyltransferase
MDRGSRTLRRNPLVVGVILAVVTLGSVWRNTDFSAPPRFDGAGYAVLAHAIATGRGYYGIDHPDAPPHAHFPPGYPLALATVWKSLGSSSTEAAHAFSVACILIATMASWLWFRRMYAPPVADWLGLSLAINWTWSRVGGSIQSEPLFLALQSLLFLYLSRVSRRAGIGQGVTAGALLAGCALTRQVGIALALASVIELAARRRWSAAIACLSTTFVLIAPWLIWLASVRENTQAELIGRGPGGLGALIGSQCLFYVQRLPDQLTGPIVEVGTVFARSRALAVVVSGWAVFASGLFLFGWARAIRSPRRRLAGWSSFAVLGLLVVWPFTEAGRFLIPLVPCILVGAVEGLAAVIPRHWARRRRLAAVLVLSASVPYAAYALITNRAESQRHTHADFDAACAWIARQVDVPGPVLTRHPGEVYWQTSRQVLSPTDADPESIERTIASRGVSYLLVDDDRYKNAPANPLARFVIERPERTREVWSSQSSRSPVRVYVVRPWRP